MRNLFFIGVLFCSNVYSQTNSNIWSVESRPLKVKKSIILSEINQPLVGNEGSTEASGNFHYTHHSANNFKLQLIASGNHVVKPLWKINGMVGVSTQLSRELKKTTLNGIEFGGAYNFTDQSIEDIDAAIISNFVIFGNTADNTISYGNNVFWKPGISAKKSWPGILSLENKTLFGFGNKEKNPGIAFVEVAATTQLTDLIDVRCALNLYGIGLKTPDSLTIDPALLWYFSQDMTFRLGTSFSLYNGNYGNNFSLGSIIKL